MSLGDLLFGSNPLPQVQSTDVSSTTYPSWYSSWLNSLFGKAGSVANEAYQPYGGPRIAPFSGDTQNAFGQVRANTGSYLPTYNAATGLATQAGQGFDQGTFNSFQNPYVSGVVDRIGQLAGRNLSENLLPAVNDSFIRSGQFGSSRNQDFTLRALRDTNESALAQQNQALAQGFDTSMENYNKFADRQLNAGQQLGALSQLGQGLRLQDAAALQGIGQQQEDKTQQSLNLAYQDFAQQRDYPRSQVEWLSSVLRGYNPGTTTTTNSSQPGTTSQMAPSTLGQLAGTALGFYGLFNSGYKKGGPARRKPVTKKKVPPMREKPVIDMEETPSAGGLSTWQMAA